MHNLLTCSFNIKCVIAANLNCIDLSNFLQTCKSCSKLSSNSMFWNYLLLKNFNVQNEDNKDLYLSLARQKFVEDLIIRHAEECETYSYVKVGHTLFLEINDSIEYILFDLRSPGEPLRHETTECGIHTIFEEETSRLIILSRDRDTFILVDTHSASIIRDMTYHIYSPKNNLQIGDIAHILNSRKYQTYKKFLMCESDSHCLIFDLDIGHIFYVEDSIDEILLSMAFPLNGIEYISSRIVSCQDWRKLGKYLFMNYIGLLGTINVITDQYQISYFSCLHGDYFCTKFDLLGDLLNTVVK